MADKTKVKRKKKLPKTVQQSIPYELIYDNGVIETEPGVFTKAYRLDEVNFATAPDEEQLAIYDFFGDFLNTFPDNVRFQILIQNRTVDKKGFLQEIKFESRDGDGLNQYRQAMNRLLVESVARGKANLYQEKYCIVSIEDNDVAHAMQTLETIDTDVSRALRRITDVKTKPMTLEERLRCLHSIYNQDGDFPFENVTDKKGNPRFDLSAYYKMGLSSKEAIAPGGMSFKANHFTIGNTFGRALYLERVGGRLSTDFLADLADLPYTMLISTQYQPIPQGKALKMVRDRVVALNAQIADAQKKAGQEGYSTAILSPELYRSQEQANELLEDLASRDQHLFYVTMTITVFGNSISTLDDAVRRINAIAGRYNAPIRPLFYQQEFGFDNCLPLCINQLFTQRLFTTEAASVLLPYTSQELKQKNGIYYGLNEITKTPILYSRLTGQNYNGLIFGAPGSGKSFFAKCEMLSVKLRDPKNRIYIIDPEDEYGPLVKALGGETINLSAGSQRYLNPLDMDLDYGGDDNPLAMKSDYIISMIEIMFNGMHRITPAEKSIVDRCVQRLYRDYLIHLNQKRETHPEITCDKDAMPTLKNLYNELTRQPETEAKTIADAIEIYANGSMQLFAHRSTVNASADVVSYNIKNLGTGMKELGLFVCLNEIWNQMIANRRQDLWTWVYIDEFYLLLRSESSTNYLMEVWKRARKWNGIPTGVMQNAEDLLENTRSRNIINLTSFAVMGNLSRYDREILGEMFQLSDNQLEYVTNAESGCGLIYTGKTVLPFNNVMKHDSPIYKLISTSGTKDALQK